MEFPFGHHRRRHDDADDEQPPRFPAYPPPGYNPYQDNYGGAAAYPPPPVYPPRVHHVSHESNAPPPPSPFPPYGDTSSSPYHPHVQHVRHEYGAPPPPFSGYPPPAQQHVSHETPPPPAAAAAYPPGGGGYEYGREESQHHQHHHHHHHLHNPFGSSNTVEHVSNDGGELAGRRTVRVFTKAKEDFSLTVRDGKVVLAPANPRDEYQHWIKDLRYNTKVKDQEGFPSFALVNKVTGESIKHSIGAKYPIHTKKRNRLHAQKLNSLVYVQFNAKLKNRKLQGIKDPIASKDKMFATEWYENVSNPQVEDDQITSGLNWEIVGEAMGVDEVLEQRRSQRTQTHASTSQPIQEEEEGLFESDDETEEDESLPPDDYYDDSGDDSD